MSQHFPFNPKTLRRGFWALAGLGSLLLGQAIRGASRGEGFPAFVRAGMCFGLMFASLWVALRLRPRTGWGVTLHAGGLLLGRPSPSAPVEVGWSQVELLERSGPQPSVVVLRPEAGRRVVLSARLFANRADFRALTEALEQHLPTPAQDA